MIRTQIHFNTTFQKVLRCLTFAVAPRLVNAGMGRVSELPNSIPCQHGRVNRHADIPAILIFTFSS